MDFVVSSDAEFVAALNAANKGDTILLENKGSPYDLTITTFVNPVEDITITSADPDDMAVMGEVRLLGAEGIHFDGLRFESNTDFAAGAAVLIRDAEDISITNSVMKGTATQFLAPNNANQAAATFADVKNITSFTFENNEMSHYYFGVAVLEGHNIRIADNDIHSLQGDPIRLGGVQNATVEGNYMHDLLGADYSLTHIDMIQVWSTNAQTLNRNIYIRNNIMDSGDGVGSQSILINNQSYAANPSSSLLYKNIVITDNVIYNGHHHGISAEAVDGLTINNNTIVTDPDAAVMKIYQGNEHSPPAINVDSFSTTITNASRNVNINNNITYSIDAPSSASVNNNILVNYTNPEDPAYITNLLINPVADVPDLPEDFIVIEDSLADARNVGADMLEFSTSRDAATVVIANDPNYGLAASRHDFDISGVYGPNGPINTNGASVAWDFGDGSNGAGFSTAHVFDLPGNYNVTATVTLADGSTIVTDRTVEVESAVALATSFYGAGVDLSPNQSQALFHAGSQIVTLNGQQVARLNSGHISYARAEDFQNNHSYTVLADFRKDHLSDEGVVTLFAGSFSITVQEHTIRTSVVTDTGGTQWMNPAFLDIDDTNWHSLALTFDNERGTAELYLDGEQIAQLTGLVGAVQTGKANNPVYLGSPFSPSFDGLIDNFAFLKGSITAEDAAALHNNSLNYQSLITQYETAEPIPEPEPVPEVVPIPEPAPEEEETPTFTPEPEEESDAASGITGISGRFFTDSNGDGLNTGEDGVAGRALLYNVASRAIVGVERIDASGTYSFENIAAGTYQVWFEPLGNTPFTTANAGNDALDSDVITTWPNATGVTANIAVSNGQMITNVDAGLASQASGTQSETANASISGRMFTDSNSDGLEPGEAGAAGRALLYNVVQHEIVATDALDANGEYSFEGLSAGNYQIWFEPTNGASFTTANAGHDTIDSDVTTVWPNATGVTETISLSAGTAISNVDAGLLSNAAATFSSTTTTYFSTTSDPDETRISFEPNEIFARNEEISVVPNGIEVALDQSNYTLTIGAHADESHTLGIYEYDGAGAVSDVNFLIRDVSDFSGQLRIDDIGAGANLGFFIVTQGADQLDPAVFASNDLELEFRSEGVVLLADGALAEAAQIFVSHSPISNADHSEHVASSLEDGVLSIGFEDGLRDDPATDDDFNDVLFEIGTVSQDLA